MAQYQICISLPQCADGRRDVDAERGDGEVEEDEAEGEDGLKGTRVNSNSDLFTTHNMKTWQYLEAVPAPLVAPKDDGVGGEGEHDRHHAHRGQRDGQRVPHLPLGGLHYRGGFE